MAQVGEFSLILAEKARHLDLLDARTYNIVLGTVGRDHHPEPVRDAARRPSRPTPGVPGPGRGRRRRRHRGRGVGPGRGRLAHGAGDHGRRGGPPARGSSSSAAGRVGRVVVTAARARGFRCVVVDRDARRLETVKRLGAATIFGDAANPEILKRVGLDRGARARHHDRRSADGPAGRRAGADPQPAPAGGVAGARPDARSTTLQGLGVGRVADPEAEAAFELARHALQRMGVSGAELQWHRHRPAAGRLWPRPRVASSGVSSEAYPFPATAGPAPARGTPHDSRAARHARRGGRAHRHPDGHRRRDRRCRRRPDLRRRQPGHTARSSRPRRSAAARTSTEPSPRPRRPSRTARAGRTGPPASVAGRWRSSPPSSRTTPRSSPSSRAGTSASRSAGARGEITGVSLVFDYYAGAANKVFGQTIPVSKPGLDLTLREPIGVGRAHRAVELPAPDGLLEGRAGAGRRQHRDPQAGAATPR